MYPRGIVAAAGVCALLLWVCACQAPATTLDLLPYLAQADMLVPAADLLVDPQLEKQGWSWLESHEQDPPVRWALAPRAEVDFIVADPSVADLELSALPLDTASLPEQSMRVELNGRPLAQVALTRGGWTERRLGLGGPALRAGRNHLVFVFAWGRSPASLGGAKDDLRPLAVAFRRLRLVTPAGLVRQVCLRFPPGSRKLVFAAYREAGESAIALETASDELPPERLFQGRLKGSIAGSNELSALAGRAACLVFAEARQSGGEEPIWRRLELEVAASARAQKKLPGPAPAAAPPPNVVLYVIDTLRADHVGAYGYARPTTPALDAFAAGAVRFARAYANSSWTRPATATILSGALPTTHRAINRMDTVSADVEMLAETFHRAGYATYGVSTNPNVTASFGFARGFDEFHYLAEVGEATSISSEAINSAVLPRLAAWAGSEKPFFLYLHSMDPHSPYRPPNEFRGFCDPAYSGAIDGSEESLRLLEPLLRHDGAAAHRADLDQLRCLYDGAILHNDRSFAALVAALREAGLESSTAILVTADHGEEFYEHQGFLHGHTLYEEQIRVPLMLRLAGPPQAGRVVMDEAQQIDIAVTLAALAGLAPPHSAQGRNLLAPGRARAIYAEVERDDHRARAWLQGDMKLHEWLEPTHAAYRGRDAVELFDLRRDSVEVANLERRRPVLAASLRQSAARFALELPRATGRTLGAEELDAATREQLQALGYLH